MEEGIPRTLTALASNTASATLSWWPAPQVEVPQPLTDGKGWKRELMERLEKGADGKGSTMFLATALQTEASTLLS